MFNFKNLILVSLITGTSLFAENKSSSSENGKDTEKNSKDSNSRGQDKQDKPTDRELEMIRMDCDSWADVERCT